jgi:hypothetical protein
MLLAGGAERTARWAIMASDTDWLRARHAEGGLFNQRGLLTHAIRSDRLEMLRLLLDLGLDPDEGGKVDGLGEVVATSMRPAPRCSSRTSTGAPRWSRFSSGTAHDSIPCPSVRWA